MTPHSEYGEDRWIAENLFLPEKGFYLDVGAGHPTVASNTAFLRESGWDGVSIDPQRFVVEWPGIFIQAAISDIPLVPFVFDGFSARIKKSKQFVAAVTLAEVIDDLNIQKIDFLSIDVEGHEWTAFNTFCWRDLLPTIIVAEYNTEGIGEDFRLRDQLLSSGLYDAIHQTIANIIYVRK